MGFFEDMLEKDRAENSGNTTSQVSQKGFFETMLERDRMENAPVVHDTALPEQQKYDTSGVKNLLQSGLQATTKIANTLKGIGEVGKTNKNTQRNVKYESETTPLTGPGALQTISEKQQTKRLNEIQQQGREKREADRKKNYSILTEEEYNNSDALDSVRVWRDLDDEAYYAKERARLEKVWQDGNFKNAFLSPIPGDYIQRLRTIHAQGGGLDKTSNEIGDKAEERLKEDILYNRKRDIQRIEKREYINNTDFEQKINSRTEFLREHLGDGIGDAYGIAEDWRRAFVSNTGHGIASVFRMPDIKALDSTADFFDKGANAFDKERKQYSDDQYDGPDFIDGGHSNPLWYLNTGLSLLSTAIPSAGVALATKNPFLGLGWGGMIEKGAMETEMIDKGATIQDAQNASTLYAGISMSLEKVNFFKYFGGSKTMANIQKSKLNKAVKEVIQEGGQDVLMEGTTEAMQQFSQNVIQKWYGMNQDLSEGILESFFAGLMGGVGYRGVGASRKPLKDAYWTMKYNINEAVNRVNGTTPVQSDMEYTMAQILLNEYQKITEVPALSQNNENTKVQVKTVEYEDGYSAKMNVSHNGNEYVSAHDYIYQTKDDAIRGTIEDNAEQIEKIGVMPDSILEQYDREIESQKQIQQTIQEDIQKQAEATDTSIADTVYHTSSKPIETLSDDTIFWTAPNKKYTENYGKKGSRITYKVDTAGLNILDSYSKEGREVIENINNELPENKKWKSRITNPDGGVSSFVVQDTDIVQKLRDMGYDGIKTSDSYKGSNPSIGILNASKVSPKLIEENGEKVQSYKSPKEETYTTQFTGNEKPLRELTEAEKVLVENYKKVLNGEIKRGKISEGISGKDGEKTDIFLSENKNAKIIERHGKYSIENLIISIHDADIVLGFDKHNNHVNYIKHIGGNKYILTSAKKEDNGKYIVTHFPFDHNSKDYINSLVSKSTHIIKNSPAHTHTDGVGRPTPTGKSDTIISKKENKANESVENLKSTSESTGISQSEKRNEDTEPHSFLSMIRSGEIEAETFKLSKRLKQIIKKLDTNYTRYVAPGSKGTFYTETGNVALQSINDIDTVHHELSHMIDKKEEITDQYQNDETIMGELEKIYLEYYPGAKKEHHPDLKMREGYAILQQYHLMNPSVIEASYPELVDTFIKNGSKLQKELNKDMNALLEEYQNLSDTEKIGAILTNEEHNLDPEKVLNWKEQIEQKIADAVLPFVKLERQSKNFDVANLLYGRVAVQQRIFGNVESGVWNEDKDFWHFNKKMELNKQYDYNWGTLVREIGKNKELDGFSQWLIARDQVGQYERLDKLNKRIRSAPDSKKKDEMIERRDEIVAYLKGNEKILPRKLVEGVHQQGKEKYKKYSTKFDNLLDLDIEALHNVGSISDSHYNAIKNSYGYAPMRRVLDDGIIGNVVGPTQVAGFKIPRATQLKGRDGGTADILNPLLGAIKNHTQIMSKTYQQHATNRAYDLLKQFPKYAQIFDPLVTLIDGKPKYTTPQGKELSMDENVITKYVDGKPKPMVVNEDLIKVFISVFKPPKQKGLEALFSGSARTFSKGTTLLYIPFFATNFIRDQFSAVMHTKNSYKTGASQIQELAPALRDKTIALWKKTHGKTPDAGSIEMQYLNEYLMLGEHQNRLNFSDMKGDQIIEYLSRGHWRQQAGSIWRYIENTVASPSNLSETGTRAVEYIKSRKAGKSQWEALEDAGQLTAPFHHKGLIQDDTFARGWIRSIPFLNATIQGTAQMARTGGTKRGMKRMMATTVSTGVSMMGMIAMMWMFADEETKQALLDMTPEEFARSIMIPLGNGRIFKIPVPHEIGWIGALFGMMINDVNGAQYTMKDYVDVSTSWLPDNIKLPVTGNMEDVTKFILSWTPQIIKPTLEIVFGKTSFPSVRNIESLGMQKFSSQYRYYESSSWFAKKLGETQWAKDNSYSPIKIDHWLNGTSGRAVGYVTGKQTGLNPIKGLIRERYFTSGRMVQKMYDEARHIDQVYTDMTKGKVPYSDSQMIEIRKRREELDTFAEDIKDYITMEQNNADEKDLIEARQLIRKRIDNYFSNGVEITELDKMRYEKYKTNKERREKEKEILDTALEAYKNDTRIVKGSIQEQKIKEQMGGDEMDDIQYKRYKELIKQFRLEAKYGDDTDVMHLFDANTNAEKALLFKEYKNKVGEERYREVIEHLISLGIIEE